MNTKEKSGTSPKLSLPHTQWNAWLTAGSGVLFHFGAGLVLSQAEFLNGYAPFALGFLAASGPGAEGFAALCGSVLGYLLGMGFSSALRYTAAAILIFSVSFAFFDLPVYQKSWFMAVSGAAVGAVTGFTYLSGTGWQKPAAIGFFSEVVLIGFSCLLFQGLDEERPNPGGLLLLAAGSGAALARFGPTPGGAAAALVTALAARGGAGTGAVTGGTMGLAVGLTAGGSPLLGGVLAFAGALTGGPTARQGRLMTGGLFCLSGLLAVVWVQGGAAMGVQVAVGTLLCLCLPEGMLRRLDGLLLPARTAPPMRYISAPDSLRRVRSRLESQAAAFRNLNDRIKVGVEKHTRPEQATAVFTETARRVCTGCTMYPVCWQREYASTRDALTAALAAMTDRGRAEQGDFQGKFRSRCLKLEEFVRVSNEELYSFWNRRQYQMRIRTSRLAVCRQYLQLSHLLETAAAGVGEDGQQDPARAAAVERGLERLGFSVQATVQLDHRQHRSLELRGKNLEGLNSEEGSAAVSRILGAKMEPSEVTRVRQGQRLVFRESPPLLATVAAIGLQKEGQSTSGDTGTWFRDENGLLWVVLCDGMGSGEGAASDSRLLMNLLEEFLHAGVEAMAALTTLTGALALRGEVNGGFTTVDLLSVDLFTGAAELFKLGGAPTYLRRSGAVTRVTGSALPAGLELDRETVPDESRFRLSAGDFVVLVSDGVTDGEGDSELRQAFLHFHGESPRELAHTILAQGGDGADDRTVIVVRISQRG